MDKNEYLLESAKLEATTHRWAIVGDTVKVLITVGGSIVAIYLIMTGLPQIFAGKSADDIGAIAKVFEAMHFGSIAGWAGSLVMTGAWSLEKSRRKRAEKKLPS
jgi:putative copper export protein